MGRNSRDRRSQRRRQAAAQSTNVEVKATVPDGAMKDLGENYYQAPSEKPKNADQFEITTKVIGDHLFKEGYSEAAETIELGEDALPELPTPDTEFINLKAKSKVRRPVFGLGFKEEFDETSDDDGKPLELGSAKMEETTASEEDAEKKRAAMAEQAMQQAIEEAKISTLAAIYQKKLELYMKREENLKKGKMYGIRCVLAQCSASIKTAINAKSGFASLRKEGDLIGVLNRVRSACNDLNSSGDKYCVIHRALLRMTNTIQKQGETGHKFRARLESAVKEFEQAGGSLSGMLVNVKADEKDDATKFDENARKSRFGAMMMFQQSNEQYNDTRDMYHNQTLGGNNMYPTTWNEAAFTLDNLKIARHAKIISTPSEDIIDAGGRSYAEMAANGANGGGSDTPPANDRMVKGTDGKLYEGVRCYKCGSLGHHIRECPKWPPKERDNAEESKTDEDGDEKRKPAKQMFMQGDDDSDAIEVDYTPAQGRHTGFTFAERSGDEPAKPEATPKREVIILDHGSTKHIFAADEEDQPRTDLSTAAAPPNDSTVAAVEPTTEHENGYSYAQVARDYVSSSKDEGGVTTYDILLDSGSSHHIWKDECLLSDIRQVGHLTVETNGGEYLANKQGRLAGVGRVWYSPKSLINVLSLKLINSHPNFNVDYEGNADKPHFLVTNKITGKRIKFMERGAIYIHQVKDDVFDSEKDTNGTVTNNVTVSAYSLSNVAPVVTVEAKKKLYTNRQVAKADKVNALIASLGYPGETELLRAIRNRTIANCPVTVDDVKRYFDIYTKNEGAVKGKTKRKKNEEVTTESLIDIPKHILEKHRKVSLCADLFFIDGFPYLTTVSKNLLFTTAEMMPNRKFTTLLDGMLRVLAFYKSKGFHVNYMFTDGEFKPMRDALEEEAQVELNTAAKNEHVPDVEANIRVIKERVRSSIHGMPYDALPANFKRELVLVCVSMLNTMPRKAGVSEAFSPRELVTGKTLDYKKHCLTHPGQYCLVHEDDMQTNTMEPRASRAIAIGPTNNLQGSYRFLMLDSARIVTRRSWDVMNVTVDVIKRVHELAEGQSQDVEFDYRGTVYTTAEVEVTENDTEHEDDDEETLEQPEGDEVSVGSDNSDSVDSVVNRENDDDPAEEAGEAPVLVEQIDPNVRRSRRLQGLDPPTMPEEEPVVDDDAAKSNVMLTKRTVKRDQFSDDYYIGQQHLQMSVNQQVKKHAMMSLKRGIKEFGKEAEQAAFKEMKSIQSHDTLRPKYAYALSVLEKQRALPMIMTVKEKRLTGEKKGRGVINGSGDRAYIPEKDATSPTATTEGLTITAAIDAHERRFVGTLDVPSAYLHVLAGKRINSHVVLYDVLVDIYLRVDPTAAGKVEYLRNGKKRLYAKMNKALYGHMMSGSLVVLWVIIRLR